MSTLEARPSFQRQATVADLVEMGRAIHARAAASGGPAGDTPANRDILREMIEDYPDFHQTFPIVMVYAVVQRLYRPEVFKEYLERLHCHNCRNNSEFLDNQSAYVGLLLRAENPRQSLKNITKRTRNLLEAHDKRFKKAGEQAREAAAMYAARGAEQARAVLLQWARSAGTPSTDAASSTAPAHAASSTAPAAPAHAVPIYADAGDPGYPGITSDDARMQGVGHDYHHHGY